MSRFKSTPATTFHSSPTYGLGFQEITGLVGSDTAWRWYRANALNSCIGSIETFVEPDLKMAA